MKRLLILLAALVGLQAPLMANSLQLTGFQLKVAENGEPIKEKPLVLRDFIELRHARGFSKAEIADLNGKPQPIDAYPGKLVVIDIWATWCEPCIRTMPFFEALQKRFNVEGSDVRVVSVSVDEKASDVTKFLKKHNTKNFTTLIDTKQKIGEDVPLDVVPSVFVLDGKGNLVGFLRGFADWGDAQVPAYLEALAKKYAKRQ